MTFAKFWRDQRVRSEHGQKYAEHNFEKSGIRVSEKMHADWYADQTARYKWPNASRFDVLPLLPNSCEM